MIVTEEGYSRRSEDKGIEYTNEARSENPSEIESNQPEGIIKGFTKF